MNKQDTERFDTSATKWTRTLYADAEFIYFIEAQVKCFCSFC